LLWKLSLIWGNFPILTDLSQRGKFRLPRARFVLSGLSTQDPVSLFRRTLAGLAGGAVARLTWIKLRKSVRQVNSTLRDVDHTASVSGFSAGQRYRDVLWRVHPSLGRQLTALARTHPFGQGPHPFGQVFVLVAAPNVGVCTRLSPHPPRDQSSPVGPPDPLRPARPSGVAYRDPMDQSSSNTRYRWPR